MTQKPDTPQDQDWQYSWEDLADRGLGADELIDGLTPVSRGDLPGLLGNYDQVWHW